MMLGEPRHATLLQTQLLQCPPLSDSPHHYHCSSPIHNTTASLHRYILLHAPDSTNLDPDDNDDDDEEDPDLNLILEDVTHASDVFRMYEFKIRRCPRGRSHDWTECPFAHPGEKARRRDPRLHRYSGTACPDFRRGSCRKGDSCELSHGVFECWLHPSRYRTQPCKDGINCRRRVCFFAHTPTQLRLPPLDVPSSPPSSSPLGSYDGSPLRRSSKKMPFSTSTSPPPSPSSALSSSMSRLQLGWGSAQRQPKALVGFEEETEVEGVVLERVESGRGLRARIAEKLSRENPLEGNTNSPDVDWISDLLN